MCTLIQILLRCTILCKQIAAVLYYTSAAPSSRSIMASTRSWVLQTIQSTISDLDGMTEDSVVSIHRAEALEWRIELVYRDLIAKEMSGELEFAEQRALSLISEAYSRLRQFVQSIELLSPSLELQPMQFLDGSVGRPRFHISFNQLETLISTHFTVPQIAQIIGVFVSTIRRRMSEYNLSIRSTYSTMSDTDLDAVVSEIQTQFSGWGNRQVYGCLVSRGIRVQFQRVRESQRRVDPVGPIMRRLNRVQRRRYSVQGPRHLWHMDGNHKLIRSVFSHVVVLFYCNYYT